MVRKEFDIEKMWRVVDEQEMDIRLAIEYIEDGNLEEAKETLEDVKYNNREVGEFLSETHMKLENMIDSIEEIMGTYD